MKKFILLLLVLTISFNLFSQKGGFIGIRIIPQSAWILNDDDFDSGDFDFKTPFSVAFALDGGYMFNNTVGIELQMLYSPQGQKYVDDQGNDFATIKNDYFKIPVLFRLRSDGGKVAFLFNVGPEFGFLVSSGITSQQGMVGPPFLSDSRAYYNDFEFSVMIGFGTSIALGTNLQLDLMIKLDYGITELETALGKEELYDYKGDGRSDSHNALAGFSVGLNYLFVKPDTPAPSLME
jgi:hypothetical protein